MCLKDKLDVSQCRNYNYFPVALLVVLDAFYGEFQHVGEDLDHGCVLIIRHKYLSTKRHIFYVLATAELCHTLEGLKFVVELRSDAH